MKLHCAPQLAASTSNKQGSARHSGGVLLTSAAVAEQIVAQTTAAPHGCGVVNAVSIRHHQEGTMMKVWRRGLLALLLAAATPAFAQRPIEIGMDATLSLTDTDPDRTTHIDIPAPRLRVGLFLSDALSFEPAFGFCRLTSGAERATWYDVEAGLLWHFHPMANNAMVYLRPFVGITGSSNGESVSDPRVGAGLGVKTPLMMQRFRWRFEAAYARSFVDAPGDDLNIIQFAVGLSFFTR